MGFICGILKKLGKKKEALKKTEIKDEVQSKNIEELKKKFEESSIPRQLQLLFARLQLGERRYTKTKALTNSFGWKKSDSFTQHDVQELYRVLFDALEKVFKGTQQENLINDLYQGEVIDCVECKNCKHKSSRADKYYDIPLVIRGFGGSTPLKSIEEALQNFIQPEILEGENQYYCESCTTKVDAIKTLKFSSFPYILTLQLKRFDFDYNIFRRVKLNDRVSFPLILNMNKFLDKPFEMNNQEKTSKRKRNENDLVEENGKEENLSDDELNEGPYLYELYSVLVHKGSALGGHYYAYIKSFENNKWFNFNDSFVQEIDVKELETVFGEECSEKNRFMSFYNSTNAYMLMYRKIDPTRNRKNVSLDEIPQQLIKVINEENEKWNNKNQEKEKGRHLVNLKIIYEGNEKIIKVNNKTTLGETIRLCAEAFELNSKFQQDCIRIRNYSSDQMDKTLFELNFGNQKTIILETKLPEETFPLESLSIQVILYDSEKNKFLNPHQVNINRKTTVGELKKRLEIIFGIPIQYQRISQESYGSIKTFVEDEIELDKYQICDNKKVYLEYCLKHDSPSPSYEGIKNLIEIQFNLIDKEDFDQELQVSKRSL